MSTEPCSDLYIVHRLGNSFGSGKHLKSSFFLHNINITSPQQSRKITYLGKKIYLINHFRDEGEPMCETKLKIFKTIVFNRQTANECKTFFISMKKLGCKHIYCLTWLFSQTYSIIQLWCSRENKINSLQWEFWAYLAYKLKTA